MNGNAFIPFLNDVAAFMKEQNEFRGFIQAL
jgi:hypothetical protein